MQAEDLENRCLVCSIDRDTFNRVAPRNASARGFAIHCKEDHNSLAYLFFLHYLLKKPTHDYKYETRNRKP